MRKITFIIFVVLVCASVGHSKGSFKPPTSEQLDQRCILETGYCRQCLRLKKALIRLSNSLTCRLYNGTTMQGETNDITRRMAMTYTDIKNRSMKYSCCYGHENEYNNIRANIINGLESMLKKVKSAPLFKEIDKREK